MKLNFNHNAIVDLEKSTACRLGSDLNEEKSIILFISGLGLESRYFRFYCWHERSILFGKKKKRTTCHVGVYYSWKWKDIQR